MATRLFVFSVAPTLDAAGDLLWEAATSVDHRATEAFLFVRDVLEALNLVNGDGVRALNLLPQVVLADRRLLKEEAKHVRKTGKFKHRGFLALHNQQHKTVADLERVEQTRNAGGVCAVAVGTLSGFQEGIKGGFGDQTQCSKNCTFGLQKAQPLTSRVSLVFPNTLATTSIRQELQRSHHKEQFMYFFISLHPQTYCANVQATLRREKGVFLRFVARTNDLLETAEGDHVADLCDCAACDNLQLDPVTFRY